MYLAYYIYITLSRFCVKRKYHCIDEPGSTSIDMSSVEHFQTYQAGVFLCNLIQYKMAARENKEITVSVG